MSKLVRYRLLLFSIIAFSAVIFYQIFYNKQSEIIQPLTNSWEIAIANQEIPEGLTSLSAEECGSCHRQHYEEWKLSTHAHAWTDLQFQSELKKESSPFFCINCHTPLQNQQEYIIEGLSNGDIYQPIKEDNPLFDQKLQLEGINCASCHVRDKAIIGLTGSKNAPHKTIKDPEFLSESLCLSCHNATAVLTPVLACTFETGDEWKSGPYSETQNCISCHMQPTEGEIALGFGKRLFGSHFFPGSGIPKFDTVQTKALNGLGIYPSTLKSIYAPMDSIIFSLKVKNENAGHNVPTGDPERHFTISFVLKNNAGDIRFSKSERIGEVWEWYPEAKKLSDNNIVPNEERVFRFTYQPKKKEQLILSVNVSKHRLDKESANYNKLGDNYPLFITVFEKEYQIEVK